MEGTTMSLIGNLRDYREGRRVVERMADIGDWEPGVLADLYRCMKQGAYRGEHPTRPAMFVAELVEHFTPDALRGDPEGTLTLVALGVAARAHAAGLGSAGAGLKAGPRTDSGAEPGAEVNALTEAAHVLLESLVALDRALPPALVLVLKAALAQIHDHFPKTARALDDLPIAGKVAFWTELDQAALQGVLRVAIGPSLVFFMADRTNHAMLTEALDTQPSRTVAVVWQMYLDHLLSSDEAATLLDLPDRWAAVRAAAYEEARRTAKWRYSGAVARALRAAAGFNGEAGATEAMMFDAMFTDMVEPLNRSYRSMLAKQA